MKRNITNKKARGTSAIQMEFARPCFLAESSGLCRSLPLLFGCFMLYTGVSGSSAQAQNAPLSTNRLQTIACVGDSITLGEAGGEAGKSGYRADLRHALMASGFKDIQFVGTQNKPDENAGADGEFSHLGYSGLRTDHLRSLICGGQFDMWFKKNNALPGPKLDPTTCDQPIGPDFDPEGTFHFFARQKPSIVLILLGTNDSGQEFKSGTTGNTIAERASNAVNGNLRPIIEKIRADSPSSRIFVSTVILTTLPGKDTFVRAFNAALAEMIAKSFAHEVTLVDGYGALTPEDLRDGTHPNAKGHAKLASLWASAIVRSSSLTPEALP